VACYVCLIYPYLYLDIYPTPTPQPCFSISSSLTLSPSDALSSLVSFRARVHLAVGGRIFFSVPTFWYWGREHGMYVHIYLSDTIRRRIRIHGDMVRGVERTVVVVISSPPTEPIHQDATSRFTQQGGPLNKQSPSNRLRTPTHVKMEEGAHSLRQDLPLGLVIYGGSLEPSRRHRRRIENDWQKFR